MEETIFSLAQTNPNNRALIVPQEDGGTEDDHYFGSIGDATQKHIGQLSQADRQLWEDLYVAKSGKIFRIEPTPAWNDPDPFSLSGKDLDEYFEKLKHTFKGKGLTDDSLAPLREAIEQEQERRSKSEDLYDHAEPIPYDTMQDHPGMGKHVEIPAPPGDRLVFSGDTSQLFYDVFPDGHPDAQIINQCLSMLNKDWDLLNDGYAQWFKLWVSQQQCSMEVKHNFKWLADRLSEGKEDPVALTERVLVGIDNVYRKQYMTASQAKDAPDGVLQLLRINRKKWRQEAEKGKNVLGSIKEFGQLLYTEFRSKMRQHHWALYRAIKREFAPRVIVRGVDINRCDRSKLYFLFGDKARHVWLKRPFISVGELQSEKFLSKDVFADDEASETLLNKMEKAANVSMAALNDLRKELIEAQRKRLYNCMDWSAIWAYYKMLKEQTEQHA